MPKCPACGSREAKVIQESPDGRHLVECVRCASIHRPEEPAEEEVRKEEALKSYRRKSRVGVLNWLQRRLVSGGVARGYARYLEKKGALSGVRQAFELGSEYGHLLRELAARGIGARGIEVNDECHAKSVAPPGTMEKKFWHYSTPFPVGNDLILLPWVLATFSRPDLILKNAADALSSGGRIFVSQGNPDSSRLRREAAEKKGGYSWYGSDSYSENRPAGVCQISADGMTALCDRLGLKIHDRTAVEPHLKRDNSFILSRWFRYSLLGRPILTEELDGWEVYYVLLKP
ncbi:MAG TPA: hypothetical protein VI893_11195 [Thermoplasmata archaeon]|nr:hypothetical protein [Thermoplasmata archaeon]